MNSISKYSKSTDKDGKLQIYLVSANSSAGWATLDIASGNRTEPFIPWPMSAKLVRYRIRDDSFNTSGMWSVAGIFYPVPRLNWWYRRTANDAWKLVSTINSAASNPNKRQSTAVRLNDLPASGWQVVAAFSDTAPAIKGTASKPTHFDVFSTDVYER